MTKLACSEYMFIDPLGIPGALRKLGGSTHEDCTTGGFGA